MTTLIHLIDSVGRLATIDADSGAVNVIGSTGFAFTDLAFAPDGRLYGITADNLYLVDATTAASTFVGALGTGNMGGAVFGADSDLYTASFSNGTLARVDAATGATISTTTTGFTTEGDLFWRDGVLYLNSTGNDIVALNGDQTGGTAVLDYGTLTITGIVQTLDGRIFALSTNRLYQIDLSIGTTTLVANLSGSGLGSVQGAALAGESINALLPLPGGGGADLLTGTAAPEKILAGGGADTVIAGAGADSVNGQTGDDVIYGNEGNDTLNGNDGLDKIFGGQGIDRVFGNEGDDILYGNLLADTLDGGISQDVLYGGQGADSLYGGAGDDILIGNRGDDMLTGGANVDRFVFAGTSGADTITDFDLLLDQLFFNAADSGFADLADVNAASTLSSGNLLITMANGASVTLIGVGLDDLTASHVGFV